MTRRSPAPRRWTVRRVAAVVTIGVVSAVGFGSHPAGPATAQSTTPAPAPTADEATTPTPTAAPPTTAPAREVPPDVLADPGVAPGTCKVVTYTPPTATEAKQGELCRPASGQRDVAVVVVHGGSGIGGSWEGMRRWGERYRAEGYVTFTPGYHLFVPGGARPVFPKAEQHVKAAVQYLRGSARALGIKPWRLVVQGQSAGARVGAVAFTTPDDPWFAGRELHAAISDRIDAFIGFYHPYDATMQYAEQYFGGGEASRDPKVLERYDVADSLSRAADASGPALFVTGSRDWDLIRTQQEAFAAVLTGRSLLARSVVVDGGGHGFDEGGARLSRLGEQAAVHTLTFLNEAFPQTPTRAAQAAPVDLTKAPDGRGEAPTTVPTRRRSSSSSAGSRSSSGRGRSGSSSGAGSSSGSSSSAGSGSGSGAGTGSGGATPTTSPPVTSPPKPTVPTTSATKAPTKPTTGPSSAQPTG